jgi:hypothetical protein
LLGCIYTAVPAKDKSSTFSKVKARKKVQARYFRHYGLNQQLKVGLLIFLVKAILPELAWFRTYGLVEQTGVKINPHLTW